jgi:hypothetical protein
VAQVLELLVHQVQDPEFKLQHCPLPKTDNGMKFQNVKKVNYQSRILYPAKTSFFLNFINFFDGPVVCTLGLMLARHAVYHLSHSPNPPNLL